MDADYGGVEAWVVVFTCVVAVLIAVLLSCTGEELSKSAPAVSLRGERKTFRQLVLPDAAVKLVEKPTSPQNSRMNRSSTMKYAMARTAEGIMAWLMHGARTPWDDLELSKEAAAGHRPLLVFVNSRSGGGQGVDLLQELQILLHRLQVVDLKEETPEAALRWWSRTGQRYRVLVCGGDGTVGWVLSCLEELQPEYPPPVAILPIGTGNDLSRVLGWGGGFGGGSVVPVLQKVGEAHAAYIDRWSAACRDVLPEGRPASLPAVGRERKSFVMCNYLGIGIDAAVALDFHQMRERSPHLFVSRMVNKAWYLKSGTVNRYSRLCHGIPSNIVLECDGRLVEVPPNMEGVVVLNISSFGGGCDLWGWASDEEDDEFDETEDNDAESSADRSRSMMRRTLSQARPSMQDGQLEVVGVHGSFQLGAAQVGLYSAVRLAQASRVKITTRAALPVQVDGEPRLFAKGGEIEISWKSQALMLAHTATGSHAVATDVIDWALERNHITVTQRNILMKEIARRAQAGLPGQRTGSLPNLLSLGSPP